VPGIEEVVKKVFMDPDVNIKQIVLRNMHRCVVCHREYSTDDIEIISRKSDIWTMLVECEDCHARNFVAAVLNDADPQEAQLALRRLTEEAMVQGDHASREDEERILPEGPVNGRPVTAGDVLDMHLFLEDFDGDFSALFRA
jgi:DNA-directed RNA polymerase subunit RPC12/RpoP